MWESVEAAQSKTVTGKDKLTVGTIPRHPGYAERILRRKIQGTLHRDGNRTSGGEYHRLLARVRLRDKSRNSGVHASAEFGPSLNARNDDLAGDPIADDFCEELLEIPVEFLRARRILKGGVEQADLFVFFEKLRQALRENGIALVLVEFRHHDWLRKADACFLVGLPDKPGGFPLTHARANADAVKNQFLPGPVFAELVSLSFADFGKFVVVRLEERSLPMSRKENAAHKSFGALSTSALLFLEIGERFLLFR